MTWTDEREKKLRELWADGLSCSRIAREIGGITRNAVIGKAHRLGLDKRQDRINPQRARSAPRPRRVPSPHGNAARRAARIVNFEPEPFVPRAVPLPSLGLPVEEWTALTCKYIEGDDGLACGHPSAPGKPYCRAHCEIVYQRPPTEREKRDLNRFGQYIVKREAA
jgi:GcrA cell cycle regulator